MASMILTGDTSGTITLSAPLVAGSNTATLPAATGELSMLGGAGQTWQDVTASRALSTTYTNSTGKPIQVLASGGYNGTNTAFMTITVDGVLLQTFNVSISGLTGGSAVVGAIVPNGSTYIVASAFGGIQRWTELR